MKNHTNKNKIPIINFPLEKEFQLNPKFIIIIFISLMIVNASANLINISQKSRIYIYLLFQIFIYIFIAFLLWVEKQNLSDFHLDTISVGLFLFVRPIMLFMYSDIEFFKIIGSIIIIIISICLINKFRSSYKLIPRIQRKTILWGIIGITIGIIERLIRNPNTINKIEINQKLAIYIVFILFYYFSQTVIEEEFIFRGFIWGYLKRIGWKDGGICIFQAVLFWIVHFYRFNIGGEDPFGFRFFIGGIILGLLVWITRSITPSILEHVSYNTMDAVVVYLSKVIK
jgi:membrane protease YdiL (CAAX protease family)